MDAEQKRTALRMIPYGLFVLGAETMEGQTAAASVTWVTQTSFEPPLIAVALKTGSSVHAVVEAAGAFALSVLGKTQQATARTFFVHREREGATIGDEPVRSGTTGGLVLENALAYLECSTVDSITKGDHTVFIGEVVDAGISEQVGAADGRPDELILTARDVGDKLFYGG